MGQVNVNAPSGSGEPAGSSGAFILGIIVAIIVIAVLVYLLILSPPNSGGTDANGNGDDSEAPVPSAWVMPDRA